MKLYGTPQVEFFEFAVEDAVCTSGNGDFVQETTNDNDAAWRWEV
ncbi:MAG: hypothetical protein ACI4RO_01010 [Candidatus Scatosoma sp.]